MECIELCCFSLLFGSLYTFNADGFSNIFINIAMIVWWPHRSSSTGSSWRWHLTKEIAAAATYATSVDSSPARTSVKSADIPWSVVRTKQDFAQNF